MLITQNFSLLRVLRTTWRVDLFIIFTCTVSHYLHQYIIPATIQIPATLATLLGTAIAFFVGFLNNQAYDRWWEARKIWGSLVNDSRSWARNVLHYTDTIHDQAEPVDVMAFKRHMVLRQIGFVYALKENLRKKPDKYFEKYLTEAEVKQVRQEKNIANAILTLNAIALQKLSKEKLINEFRFIQFNNLLTGFTDQMGMSERISNTVFPTSYVYFTRLFIWVLVVFTTLILSEPVGVWSILIGWIVGFVFHVTHQNGMRLMEPFEDDQAGIPLNQISRVIEINLLEMLGEKDIPPPIKPIDDEYIL